jgi:glc operon protein GlcG
MFQQTCLSHSDAQKIIDTIRAELEQRGQGAAIAVVDAHGELLAFLRTDGCRLPSINIAINKAFTASRERRPSSEIGESSRTEAWPLTNFGDLRYTGWGGGVPIIVGEQVVGGIGVSGLPETEDIELAQKGAVSFEVGLTRYDNMV